MKNEITMGYKNYTYTLMTSNRQKAWMAEVTGTDPKYTFKRNFLEVYEDGGRWIDFRLEDGKLYNWNEGREQHFGFVEDGKLYEISKHDAVDIVTAMEAKKDETMKTVKMAADTINGKHVVAEQPLVVGEKVLFEGEIVTVTEILHTEEKGYMALGKGSTYAEQVKNSSMVQHCWARIDKHFIGREIEVLRGNGLPEGLPTE